MKTDILLKQYAMVCSSRNVVFCYCETIAKQHFRASLVDFGGRSIHYMLVHVANTYKFWLGEFGLKQEQNYESYGLESINAVKELYAEVDQLVLRFIARYKQKPNQAIAGKVKARDDEFACTPLELFTHVITHEFHHKGQIMTMSRILGYTPPDADVVRFI